jgi:hypothetical protein
MRRSRVQAGLIVAVVALFVGTIVPSASSNPSKRLTAKGNPLAVLRASAGQVGLGDADAPPVGLHVDPRTYLSMRAHQTSLYRGAPFTLDYNARQVAVQKFQRAMANRGKAGPSWTAIGPAPIPNGQTSPTNAVSGRVTAIAVDPTDPNVVYVGTANGGVWRSKNGGTNWTALFDDEATLAIGSLAIAPSSPSTLYVGTGEGNLSGDSYAGLGLYRINSANGTTPVVNGPFETRVAGTGTGAGNGHAFNFLSIQGIAIDPGDAGRVFLAATPGGIGMAGDWVCCASPSADPGLYLTTNGTAATPTFSKVAGGLPQSSGNFFPAGTDVSFAAGSATTLLVGIEDIGFQTSANNGIWRSTNAANATPSFSKITLPNTVFNTRIATGPSSTVLVGAESTAGARLYKSTDDGATFPTTLTTANGFCGQQCFYDIAPAIDPSNANKMLLGGSADSGGANVLMRAADGATFSSSDGKLHADSHATEYAPSNPSIAYAGNDGGIWKSTDGGATWTSLNNSQFSATQFESVAVHPDDPNFSIGGTQDNGTMWYQPAATWNRADFGDGGFAAIDQNAANNTNVTMYHTYFNQANNLVGYAFVTSTATASDGNWGFRGCGNGFTSANGIGCSEDPLFYAPLELGGGTPNSVYYGTDRLHRSTDSGANNPIVSQDFGSRQGGGAISAIGVSPTNDNVRLVGLNGGGIFGTTTGANPLIDLDPGNTIPNRYVARIVVDPNNADVAYVTIDGFNGGTGAAQSHVWKTTDINTAGTTWVAKNSGLPDVPVNAMVIDPLDSNDLYIGTDIGVYASTNGGTSWAPFGSGLPVVPIFDMAIASPGTANEVLRVATHGRGMYEAELGAPIVDNTNPTASLTQPSKSVTISKTINIAWNANDTGGSGLDDVDLRVKSANFNSGFGAFTQPASLQHLTGTSKAFTGVPGHSYCFSVRARDNAGNLSAFSGQKCTMIPVDDKPMTASTGWQRKTGQAGAFLGTLSVASQANKTLSLNSVHARQIGILTKRCSNCGTFTITFNGQTFSANSAGSGFVIFTIPATSTVKTSKLVLKVISSGKPVQIDGVAAPQTGAITFGPPAVPMHRVG